MSLLELSDLHVHFIARDREDRVRTAKALNGVGFTLDRGEILGLVGETGAGKSLTALTIMGLLRPPAKIVRGSVKFDGQELVGLPDERMNDLRGNSMALVVQSPKTSLDPLTRVGEQVARIHYAHRKVDRGMAREKAVAALAAVGIPDPARRALAWPHELSGGMAQRVLIAAALINEPRIIIADEPTTGLDVTVQAQILDLLQGQVRDRRLAALIITHDLGIVAHYCDRMAVMFAGAIVESGPVRAVFAAPRHPYTRALLGSAPDRMVPGQSQIRAGAPPNLYDLPPGCPYADRCPKAQAICATPPPVMAFDAGHAAHCHFPEAGRA
jgi:peptide/nickel transport system ATP-binding protein/oligopeptide transport system ATP-binding protein